MNGSQPLAPRTKPNRVAVSPTPTSRQLYWQGFDAYCDGAKLEAMRCEPMRRGWWAALKAASAAASGYDCYMGW